MKTKKALSFIFGTAFILCCTLANAGDEQLWGSWRLISFKIKVLPSGQEKTSFFGPASSGILNYGRDGRVVLLIIGDKGPKVPDLKRLTDEDRVRLFNTMIACGGTYKFDGKTVTHNYDISWNDNWTGESVPRHVTFEGGKLILTAPPAPSSVGDGTTTTSVLTWEKIQ